jgi:hypothetical protein
MDLLQVSHIALSSLRRSCPVPILSGLPACLRRSCPVPILSGADPVRCRSCPACLPAPILSGLPACADPVRLCRVFLQAASQPVPISI